jgi:hypothetical protein
MPLFSDALSRSPAGQGSARRTVLFPNRIADRGWRPPVDFAKDGIEPPEAAKAGAHRNVSHRQVSLVEQSFSPLNAGSLCHLRRTSTNVLCKKPAQVPGSDAQPVSKDIDTALVERIVVNQAHGSFHCGP